MLSPLFHEVIIIQKWYVNLQQQTLACYSKSSLLDMLCMLYHAFITKKPFDAAEECHCTSIDGAQLSMLQLSILHLIETSTGMSVYDLVLALDKPYI